MALSQMDVPTRQIYIVGVVSEDERTAAAGITNISRNVAQSISPSIAGSILQSLFLFSAPFIIGGVLKIVYDVALYVWNFKNTKPSDESKKYQNNITDNRLLCLFLIVCGIRLLFIGRTIVPEYIHIAVNCPLYQIFTHVTSSPNVSVMQYTKEQALSRGYDTEQRLVDEVQH